jgi:Rieske Fe-S protein
MKRNEFLTKLGIGAAIVCAGGLAAACSSGSNSPTPEPGPGPGPTPTLPFTLETSSLATVGSSTVKNGVLIGRINAADAASSFIALQSTCTHEGYALSFEAANERLHCNNHGSNFALDGSVINGPVTASGTATALKKYKVTLSGTTITISQS